MPAEIDRVQVLTDGAAVVEPQAGVDRQPIADVIASLANAEAVMNTPPMLDGALETAGMVAPLLSTNLVRRSE